MDDTERKKEIDFYDIFELMGLSKMSDENKNNMLYDMNLIVWNEFLFTRIEKLLTEEQLNMLKKMIDDNKEISEVITFITSIVPNFNNLLSEYTREHKIKFIKQHFSLRIEDLNKSLDLTENKEEIDKINLRIKNYKQADVMLENYDWIKLKDFMLVQENQI